MKTIARLAVAAAMLTMTAPAIAQERPTTPAARPAAPAAATFTDAQLAAFAAAKAEMGANATDAQKAAVLQRHGLDAVTYAAIGEAARNDAAVARRIAAIQAETAPPPKR